MIYIVDFFPEILADNETIVINSNTHLACEDPLQVVNIVNVTSIRRKMQCGEKQKYGTISSKTIEYIQKLCNNKSSCKIKRRNISDMEPFLEDFGF